MLTYKLSDKMVHPTNIEKTNVGLADACMSLPSVLSGITPNMATVKLQKSSNTFEIGQRTKDANRMPIKREERNVLQVFHKFGQRLRTRESSGEVGLSKQTFQAAI